MVSRTRPATTVTARPITVAIAKCGSGARCGASRPPTAAPASPPSDHAAWNDGITGRRSAATTSTATVFAATLTHPYPMPNTTSPSPSATADLASAGSSSASDSHPAPQISTRTAPNRRQSTPDSAIVAIAPPDTPSSATPSSAGDAPVAAFTAGMRTAQVAKMNPSKAKNAVAAARTRLVACCPAAGGTAILFSSCTK